MRSFKEFMTEALVPKTQNGLSAKDREYIAAQGDRKPGDAAVDVNGKEIRGSMILSKGANNLAIAFKEARYITIEVYSAAMNTITLQLSPEEFSLLKKVR